MTFDENSRVDVNTATASYTVDQTPQNMSHNQEPTVEYIVVRKDDNETAPACETVQGFVNYRFPLTGVVRIIKRTTIEEVLYEKRFPEVPYDPMTDSLADSKKHIEAENAALDDERNGGLFPEVDLSFMQVRKERKDKGQTRHTLRSADTSSCCASIGRRMQKDGFCRECRPASHSTQ